MNLGSIHKDKGNLDDALAFTLKSIELNICNPEVYINLGLIYQDIGRSEQAILAFAEARKYPGTKDKASMALSSAYYYLGMYSEALHVLSGTNSKEAKGMIASLYLCLDRKNEFISCAKDLILEGFLDPRSIAAINHANILYGQCLDLGPNSNSFNSISIEKISQSDFSDSSLQRVLSCLANRNINSRSQGHLVNGLQTSGNIFDISLYPFQELKSLIFSRISDYIGSFAAESSDISCIDLALNRFVLRGWGVVMDAGGSLKMHNHESGLLTGTFYLQMPDFSFDLDEGAIEFSQQGPRYPQGLSVFEKRVIRPNVRDLNIFPSSLFHRTIPFHSETQRICVAFDLLER